MTVKAQFDAEEWSTVTTAPALTAMLMIASDRGGTVRETVSASRAYAEARRRHPDGLLAEVIASPPSISSASSPQGPEQLHDQALAQLTDAVRILARHATDAEVDEYKRFVYSVAEAVAHAHRSGGFLGIGGKPVSEHEQRTLDEIAAIFDAPPPA